MLMKDDANRPTTSNILDMPYCEKYMISFIQEKENKNDKEKFEDQAAATAKVQRMTSSGEGNFKMRPLTAKEKMNLRKQQKAKLEFERMKNAAMDASKNLSKYYLINK